MFITGTKTEKQPSWNKSPHSGIEAAACDCGSVGLRDESFGLVHRHCSCLPPGRASQHPSYPGKRKDLLLFILTFTSPPLTGAFFTLGLHFAARAAGGSQCGCRIPDSTPEPHKQHENIPDTTLPSSFSPRLNLRRNLIWQTKGKIKCTSK